MTEVPDAVQQNRLDDQQSPYLRQHADNPVNWQPWDETAIEAARELDRPIFLSIGYSACHWCHVMESESFADPEVARVLNEQFVPIKVDREERPDLDSIYMSICQQVTGRGGWPLNAWLTPEGEPFYVGTYFPPEARRGTPGFSDLLADIADSWADPEDREEMRNRAAQWTDAIESELEDVPDAQRDLADDDLRANAADAAIRGADREHGGWGGGPKFPQPARVHVLARAARESDRTSYREVLEETLDAMATGGLYDHLDGGFHRYATDREWVVPHFEKMLYDNAELPRIYLAGYQLTGDERYRDVATETLDFLTRELQHPDGGFFSTLDAQSPPPEDLPLEDDADTHGGGVEGAFYVWTPDAVRRAIETHGDATLDDVEQATTLFCDRYGVDPAGNFEGTTVLTLSASIEELADEHGLDADAVHERLSAAETAVREARDQRPRPNRDEKILAGWNGLAIGAFAEAALTVDTAYAEPAADALSFVREHLWTEHTADEGAEDGPTGVGRLRRRYKDGDVAVDGYLEDYAFLGRGALALYEATGEVDHLAFALELARSIESEFYDADAGTLYFTPQSGESLVARPQELTDQSTPSSAGVAAELLFALDAFVPHDRFGSIARQVLDTHSSRLAANPLQHASLVLAGDVDAHGHAELTIAPATLPDDWRTELAQSYVPRRLLAPRPGTDDELADWLDRLELEGAPPIWAGRTARDDEPTVYACRDRTCSQPYHDVVDALSWFDRSSYTGRRNE